MKINETRKGKYNKIILKEKRKKQITEKKKQNREQKKRDFFFIVMKKNHTGKRMRFELFLQTSNLHLNKQKIEN